MSDPVTNLEIEDVLSSIRRLVSEDHKPEKPRVAAVDALILTPAQRVTDPPAPNLPEAEVVGDEPVAESQGFVEESATEEPAPGADDDVESAAPEAGDEASDDEAWPGADAAETAPEDAAEDNWDLEAGPEAAETSEIEPLFASSLVDRVAGLEDVISKRGGEWEPDGSEAEQEPRATFAHWENEDAFAAEDDVSDEAVSDEASFDAEPLPEFRHEGYAAKDAAAAEPAEEHFEPAPEEPGETYSAEEQAAEDALERALNLDPPLSETPQNATAEPDEPEAAGHAEVVPDDDWIISADRITMAVQTAEGAKTEANDQTEPPRADGQDPVAETPEPLVEVVAEAAPEPEPEPELEPAEERTVSVAEADEAAESGETEETVAEAPEMPEQAGPDAGDAPEMAEEETPEAPEISAAEAPEPAQDALANNLDDEGLLDEEAVRKLVRDVTREELQGALGERITRNVRKLVRREIHRALASRELE